MAEFKRVANVADIPEGQMRGFEVGFDKVAVCHTSEGFFAITDECSHDAAPISSGSVAGNEVVCPRHGARFDLKTGDVTAPPAVVGIDTLELKIENDEIFVKVD